MSHLKTEFILQYLSEPELRRRIRRGLLKVEQLNALAGVENGHWTRLCSFLHCLSNVGAVPLMCFPRLRVALVSAVYLIVLLSGCATPYASIGGVSEIRLAPDIYRVLFSPTGYMSWDLAYRVALQRCAELTIENGYRYFAVGAIDNYSSATSFALPGNGKGQGFYDARTAYNPPHSASITYWPLPALTIKMLRDPIPGVTLDAKAIQSSRYTSLKSVNERARNHFQYQPLGTVENTG